MADMTKTVRIWSHVRQIAPLSKEIAGDAWFSLNLAPVFVTDPAGTRPVAPDLARQYLLPWTWQWTSLRMALLRGGVVQKVIDVTAAQILREDPTATPDLSAVFNDEFDTAAHIKDGKSFQSSAFVEDKTKPKPQVELSQDSERIWKMWLMHASTYAGDIPLRAGLAAWFHVPYSQLANVDEIVVAPVFAGAPFAAACAPPDPASTCLDLKTSVPPCALVRLQSTLDVPPGANDTMWVTRWTYGTPAPHDLQAEWIQPRTDLRIPGTAAWKWGSDGFIDEETLWVTPQKWGQGADGHEQLEQRLSGLFDLPLRLIEWADQAVAAGSLAGLHAHFGTALLATMRDVMRTAGHPATQQVVDRPDGVTVADDIARVLAPSDTALRAQILTQVQTYCVRYDQYAAWIARVNAALTGSVPFGKAGPAPGWENPPASGSPITDFQDWLKLVHKARAWLFDPVNLKAFIRDDWDNALSGTPFYANWLNKKDDVKSYLTNTDILTVLRLGFLGAAWRGQKATNWYAPPVLAQNMNDALINVYRERLHLQPQAGWGYQNLLPATGTDSTTVPQAVQASVEKYLAGFIDKWKTSPNGPNPDPTKASPADYSRGNRGINIQFSNQATADTTDAAAQQEQQFLATFRGVAVMLRPSGQNPAAPWSLLHLGQYALRGTAKPAAFDPDRLAVAPTQIVYRNGLRQVSCTYRNHPLSARSPAAELSQRRSFQGEGQNKDSYANQPTGLFELWNAYGRPGSPYKLSRLICGVPYDTAAFAIGLAGELPPEICDAAKPWRVRADPSKWAPPANAILTTPPYLRTVPLGVVRVEGPQRRHQGEGISKMSGAAMPDKVFPMVRSLKKIDDQQDPVFLLCPTKQPPWNPGVVDSATFYIRPPATDLATFDSWPITPAPPVADRAALYSFLARNNDIKNDQGNVPRSQDLTLDDPAVAGFSVTLSQVYPKAIPGTPKSFEVRRGVPDSNSPTPKLMQQYQSPSARVDIHVGAEKLTVPQSAADPYVVTIQVPAGSIYQVDIVPVAAANYPKLTLRQNLAPRTFYVEVATPLNVLDLNAAAKALNSALITKPAFPRTPGQKDDQITVQLDLGALPGLAPQIHRVELMVQRWRWQGRPLARFDAGAEKVVYNFPYDQLAAATSANDLLKPLDGIYFGERDSNDHLIVGAAVDALIPGGEKAQPQIYSYDLSSSPQALYYRFAVRVFSRYEGLLATNNSVESRIVGVEPGTIGAPPPEQWRRVLPLCRRTKQAPKPAVRLIIPLTRTGPDESTPGLLAVLDDKWYDFGGLAEELQVQIATVKTPDDSKPILTLTQAGPDPIVSNRVYGDGAAPLPEITSKVTPIGPIGFTTDTNPSAPLFTKTSFVIPAPQSASDGTKDFSWWFLFLQFRRALNPKGTLSTSGDLLNNSSLDSDWTLPVQAQLLPAANLWDMTWTGNDKPERLDTAALHADFTDGNMAVRDSQGRSLTVNPYPADTGDYNRFEVWVLLTVQMEDAFGNGGQEAFLDLVPFHLLAPYHTPTGKIAPDTLRLVEVQCMKGCSRVQTDWRVLADDLFPASVPDTVKPKTPLANVDPAMARARIIRVSPPIKKAQ